MVSKFQICLASISGARYLATPRRDSNRSNCFLGNGIRTKLARPSRLGTPVGITSEPREDHLLEPKSSTGWGRKHCAVFVWSD